MSRAAAQTEAPGTRRIRRAATVPAALLGGLLAPLFLLPGLLLALAADALRRRGLVATRAVAFGAVFLLSEAGGLIAAGAIWLAAGPWTGKPPEHWLQANFRLQCLWARALFGAARRIFALKVQVDEGQARLGRGPLLLFARHASILDTLLPAVFVSARHRLRLRTVLKRELLADPCLDVVGNRLPNVFVRRGSERPEAEIASIAALGRDLALDEGVLIYPEGTRFTPARREQALARLAAAGDGARRRRAEALRSVLPPRSAGPLALLEAAPEADVVFLAHVGLEGLVTPGDALRHLAGRRLALCFWRVPCSRIPESREARLAWLDAEWARLDAWVARGGRELPRAAAG